MDDVNSDRNKKLVRRLIVATLLVVGPAVLGCGRRNSDGPESGQGSPVTTLAGICDELMNHPPDGTRWARRRKLLEAIDVPINARQDKAWRRDTGAVFRAQMERALDEICEGRVTTGVRVWRMYNMGFVVKSADATIGFDIHPGWVFDSPMDQAQLKRLADQLDAAFVSHWHYDHCSRPFLRQMLAAGKKIVLLDSLAKELTGPNVYRIPGKNPRPLKIAGVEVFGHTGRQFPTARNNVYVVRIGGLLVMHQGDNDKTALYRTIAAEHEIDVLLVNCWARMTTCISGISPELVITGHENEIRHPSMFRSGYRKTFRTLDRAKLTPPQNSGPQLRVMFWGEHTNWPIIGSQNK